MADDRVRRRDGRFAELDLDRARRRGYPEAVLCAGKTPAQVAADRGGAARAGARTLFTRADPEHAAAVLAELPDALHADDCGLLAWPAEPPEPVGGRVLVVAAGTVGPRRRPRGAAHRPPPRPARGAGDGRRRRRACTGCSGKLDALRAARVIVVVAGMDGALPAVVAGLVAAPVVAVPTSTGYGAAFGGLAALLGMLNSCAPGVAVVNIDNGYGAGHLAAQIAAPA